MRAVRYLRRDTLSLEDVTLQAMGPDDVRIRPSAVGLCGTDARIVEGAFFARPGVVLGHEIAGVVEAIGSSVTNVREGDLVTVEPHLYCGACRSCRLGSEHLCPDKRAFGVHLDGGMAESLVVPGRLAYVLPPGLDPSIGCLAEPLACAIHGIDRLAPISGLPALVLGAGPAGLMLAALARMAGLAVVVVEPDPRRREVARAMVDGAVIDPGEDGWRERAMAESGGTGFDFLIEATGSVDGLEAAVSLAARRGRILVYGVARPDDAAAIKPYEVYARELTIIGSALNPYTHLRAVELLPQLGLERIDRGLYPLDDYEAAFAAQRARTWTKVVLAPNASSTD